MYPSADRDNVGAQVRQARERIVDRIKEGLMAAPTIAGSTPVLSDELLARCHERALAVPRPPIRRPPQPFDREVHTPDHSSRPSGGAGEAAQGRSCRSANRTFAGRSASRRMYHAYQALP